MRLTRDKGLRCVNLLIVLSGKLPDCGTDFVFATHCLGVAPRIEV
jgi:hypothetical protein